jgi:ABC-type glycerol-3-phosphate transport system substrate-binding protein
MKARKGLRLFGGLTLLAWGACPSAGDSMDELYQAARSEGTVVIYGGGPATWYDPWVKKFEARFPGVKVAVKAGSSKIHADDIDAQIRAGKLQVDTAILQTVQDYERWKRAGVLLAFKPDGFEKIADEWKDKDGVYVGVTVHGLT